MSNMDEIIKKMKIEEESRKIFEDLLLKNNRVSREEVQYILSSASDDLKNDFEFMKKLGDISTYRGTVLRYAGDDLRKNREYVLSVLGSDLGNTFKYIDEELKKDKSFIIEAIKRNPNVYTSIDEEFKNDKDITLELAKNWSYAMQYSGDSLKGDMDIILESIRTNSGYFGDIEKNVMQYVDEELKATPEFKKQVEEFQELLKRESQFVMEKIEEGLSIEEAKKQWEQQLSSVQQKDKTKSEEPSYEINEYGEIIRPNNTKTSLQQKEEELSSLEEEEKKISEAEAIIKKEMDKKGKDIGE